MVLTNFPLTPIRIYILYNHCGLMDSVYIYMYKYTVKSQMWTSISPPLYIYVYSIYDVRYGIVVYIMVIADELIDRHDPAYRNYPTYA